MKIVLDLGCGFDKYKGKENEKVIGVDIEKGSHADVIWNLESYPYPFKDNSVDKIISTEVIEHIWSYEKFISECHRILKTGGELIIATPNRNSFINKIFKTYLKPEHHIGPYAHKHIFTKEELEYIFKKHGFKVEEIWYKHPKGSANKKWATIPRIILHYILPKPFRELIYIKGKKL